MGFLFKFLLCVALIYAATQWRPAPSSNPRASAVHAASKARPEAAPALDAAAGTLLRSGADKLTASAREWCLSAPSDCVAMLQRTQAKAR